MKLKEDVVKTQVICRQYNKNRIVRTLSFIVYDVEADKLRSFLKKSIENGGK